MGSILHRYFFINYQSLLSNKNELSRHWKNVLHFSQRKLSHIRKNKGGIINNKSKHMPVNHGPKSMDLIEKTTELSLNNENGNQQKREDYIEWKEYFMAIAFLAAKRSKDPSFQVGACVVNRENKILGIGYNGMPIGCSDDEFPWSKNTPSPLDSKYLYVCHAEMNAIMNKNSADVKDCAIYVGLFPCNECAKIIIQSGINEVIYFSDKNSHKDMYIASKRMFDAAGVKYWQFIPKRDKIEIKFTGIDWENMSPSK